MCNNPVTKNDEIKYYHTMYLLVFGKNARFFYSNDSATIFNFLKIGFWGESLRLRVILLSKLLYYDSYVNPQFKKELRIKSKELVQYITPLQA